MRKTIRNLVIKVFDKSLYNYIAKNYNKISYKDMERNNVIVGGLTKKEKVQVYSLWGSLGVKFHTNWHYFYKNYIGYFDSKFVPNEIFNGLLETALNPLEYSIILSHKGFLYSIIDKQMLPNTLVNFLSGNIYDINMNPITFENAISALSNEDEFVVKESAGSGGGNGVRFFDFRNLSIENKQEKTRHLLASLNRDYVIQSVIPQDEEFKKFNPKSVNTIRLVSLNLNQKVSVLSSFLRMGMMNMRVDNLNSGGMLVGIKPNGELHDFAVDGKYNKYTKSPAGVTFKGETISYYELIKSKAIELHLKIPFLKMIGWDFTVKENGIVVVVEINLASQQLEYQQIYNGPLFGDRTEEVIEYVKNNPPKRIIYG
jgi:hypothetical protein